MNIFLLDNYDYFPGQPENLEPSATTAIDEVEAGHLTVSSETRVDINSGEANIVQYFNVDDNSNESSGQSGDTEQFQPSRLSPAPVTRSRPQPPLPPRK